MRESLLFNRPNCFTSERDIDCRVTTPFQFWLVIKMLKTSTLIDSRQDALHKFPYPKYL